MDDTALNSYKVLEVGHYVAAPYCGKLLAGFGAEVIKIEKPGVGDGARRVGPFLKDIPDPETSALYLWLNTNKKSVTLDLKSETGQSIFLQMVKDTDIVLENLKPGSAEKMGITYPVLSKVNPGIIVTSISNFGHSGPYRDYKGAENVLQAIAGLSYVTGEPDREPLPIGGNQAQYQGGANAFEATLAALWYRETGGEGQHIDISLMESISQILENLDVRWEYQKEISQRTGRRWVGRAAWGLYPCADGWASIVSGPPRRWEAVSNLMEEPLLANPDYATGQGSVNFREEIESLMMPWLKSHTKEEIYHAGQEAGIPFAMVCDFADILKSPQLKARGYFVEIDHPKTGPLIYPGAPAKMVATPWVDGRSPLLGEHNVEVLGGRYGYSQKELVELRARGVI